MRGGKRAGAGAPVKVLKRDQAVCLKFTREELIEIDVMAATLEMDRSKFIRFCIELKIISFVK